MTGKQIQKSARSHLRSSEKSTYRVAKDSQVNYGHLCAWARGEIDLGLKSLIPVLGALGLRIELMVDVKPIHRITDENGIH